MFCVEVKSVIKDYKYVHIPYILESNRHSNLIRTSFSPIP